MHGVRKAEASDAAAIASLLINELPNDPLLSLLSRAKVLEKFIESLVFTNSSWIIERNGLIGVITIGKLNETLVNFRRHATLHDFFRIVSAAALPSRLTKLMSGVYYIARKPKDPSRLEITWIAIDHRHHGNGLGGDLLNLAVTSILKKGEVIWVKTLGKTPANIRFYQKHHFEVSHYVGGRVILTRSLGVPHVFDSRRDEI